METWQARDFSDQLNIATPEQVDLSFPLAGIGSRFVALLLDTLIQIIAYLLLALLVVLLASATDGGSSHVAASAGNTSMSLSDEWIIAIFIFINFCIIWGYFTLFEAFWHGQTPGKRLMKLRVLKSSGRQVTLFESLTRNLLRVIDYLPSGYLVGLISMACTRANQRLGDLAAGTIVVHERSDDQPLFVSASGTLTAPQTVDLAPWAVTASNPVFPADAIARLAPADLNLVESFFARALDLPLETRATLADRIARKLTSKMQTPLPEGNPERSLEAIAHAMRGTARLGA